jgi:hypothetical protein
MILFRDQIEGKKMNKDIFIDVANIFLGINAIFWFGVAMLPYMQGHLSNHW